MVRQRQLLYRIATGGWVDSIPCSRYSRFEVVLQFYLDIIVNTFEGKVKKVLKTNHQTA